jgi:hypothetical protein
LINSIDRATSNFIIISDFGGFDIFSKKVVMIRSIFKNTSKFSTNYALNKQWKERGDAQ